MINCAIIIPALNPSEALVSYVNELLSEKIAKVIVVNDGSNHEYTHIFSAIAKLPNCTVLTHAANKGKGRALKTAFTYYLNENRTDLLGVITADADGQHSVQDVCQVARALMKCKEGIILGVRDFSEKDVPFRSYFGNRFTSLIFQLLYRKKLKDTQTGLRGIPNKELIWAAELNGEKYEYEIIMLIHAVKSKLPLHEIRIDTLYFNKNDSSHFHPLFDSFIIIHKMVSNLFPISKGRE